MFVFLVLVQKSSIETKMKDTKDMRKEFDKTRKTHSVVKPRHVQSPKSLSKKSKLPFLPPESPKLKGVAGYLWKVNGLKNNISIVLPNILYT